MAGVYNYRKATMHDLEDISDLISREIGTCEIDTNEEKKKNFKEIKEINKKELSFSVLNYFICEIEDKVVGACGISELLPKDHYEMNYTNCKEILYCAVDHKYQRRGIGTKLMELCCENTNDTIIYEAWGANKEYVNSKYILEKLNFKMIKDLGNDYYKKRGYCPYCVNRNKICDSCSAQLWVREGN